MTLYNNQLENFLSASECEALVRRAEQLGFEAATVAFSSGAALATHIRNNDRVVFEDQALADDLWRRLSSAPTGLPDARQAVGLNARFRFYRYDASQRFKPHKDGEVQLAPGLRSRVTVLFYLNAGFSGGETVLMPAGPRPEDAGARIAVRPSLGGVLLFSHQTWHEGRAVEEGRKYVLRSDVLYEA
jgi:predicted 2-oxoglutarate/Fe(II)-dependent dioxygenase YbiX